MKHKTNPINTFLSLIFIMLCLGVSILVLWGFPIGQKIRPILLQETSPTQTVIKYVISNQFCCFSIDLVIIWVN